MIDVTLDEQHAFTLDVALSLEGLTPAAVEDSARQLRPMISPHPRLAVSFLDQPATRPESR